MSEAEHRTQPNIGSELSDGGLRVQSNRHLYSQRALAWPLVSHIQLPVQTHTADTLLTSPLPHYQDYGHTDGFRQLLSASMTITGCQWPGLRVMGGTRPGHGDQRAGPALPSCEPQMRGGGWSVRVMSGEW